MIIKVNRIAEQKIKRGIQLLDSADFIGISLTTDELVDVYTSTGQNLGKAYLSQQNKGIGWFISSDVKELSSDFFVHLFKKARKKRQTFFQSNLTNAFRLFNQDGDHFGGVTIDLYNEYAVFSWYNTFVYSMKDTIIAAFQMVFPEVKGAYEKIRFKGLDFESAFLYGQEAPEYFTVLENGVSYQVFMNDGLMTGIFLDQHEVRGSLVDGLATGKTLLNMFSYTAAFSIAAAMGGATETTSVDLAKRSRELSKAHFKVNGVELDNHHFVVMDVFEYFKYAKRKGLSYDVIVLDPPSFARNKKQTFSVAKDYHKLISQSLEILNPKGMIIASTNAANVSVEKFRKQIEKGFGPQEHRYVATYRLPADFTINKNDESSNYLKVFTIRVEK
ncbi:TPA: class I SAM-dependent rRNA methyltransferase [Streptococcus suis]|nr:class I SAM-dependent rRNA methyltransferase [Streptococcus suis]